MTILKRTKLYDFHLANNAKIVPFNGWEMPLNYQSGISQEHFNTRNKSSLFDVSHMGQLEITGKNAELFLKKLIPTDLENLDDGNVKYSMFLNENGGIIDDLMIYRLDGKINLVVNAGRLYDDIRFLETNIIENVNIHHKVDYSLIAIQGPKSREIIKKFGLDLNKFYFMKAKKIKLDGVICSITCCGYTGEDGFELSVKSSEIEKIVNLILSSDDIMLAGLGARDTLRMEAGLPLWGKEISEKINPIEANLQFALNKNKIENSDFHGSKNIAREILLGPEKKLVGLLPQQNRPIRDGAKLFYQGKDIGYVTSGGFSPTLNKPISIGFIKNSLIKKNRRFETKIGEKIYTLQITTLPFVKHNYYRR